MKNSIETIWKEGFLNEKSLVAPKINDLYNQKSKHVVDKIQRMFRINLMIIIITAIVFPVIYYFLDSIWQGAAASVLLLLTGWYNKHQMQGINMLDQGANSLAYLRSVDRWLKDVISKSGKLVRFSYPLYFLIAMSTIWTTWTKQKALTHQKISDSIFVGDIPLTGLIVTGVIVLLMMWFSDKIYKWDIRFMYGRVFDKLEETIAEMEKLEHE